MNIARSMTKAEQPERDQKHQDAARIYGDILAKFPKNTRARDALIALKTTPRQELPLSEEQQNALRADFAAEKYAAVASTCAALLNSNRKSHFLWNMLGNCHLKSQDLDAAATCLNKACELAPRDAATFAAMADVSRAQGQIDNALTLYRKALKLDETLVCGLSNMADTLIGLGRLNEATPLLQQAASLAPDDPDVLSNYSNVLLKTGQTQKAKALLERATELAPQLENAQYKLAQLQSMDGDTEQAIEGFNAMLEKTPGDDRTRAEKLHAQAQLCDWGWVAEYQRLRRQLGLAGQACPPLAALTFEDNPDLLRLRIQAHANAALPSVRAARPLAAEQLGQDRPQRLRIGYFSPDYHDHATMRLMAGLFEAHDQSRFDIIAYSYDATPADAMRSRIRKAVTSFKDISRLSDAETTQLVQQDKLDIAVDLKGFAPNSRTALFAERLAPLQMSYLGFPGTLGSTAMDYLIADSVACPLGSERYYEEHLLRLPHSYQANDNKRHISADQYTRKDCGLPDRGFVFCSFNSSDKITPAEFDIWMRLLDQVPGSVLWLLDCGDSAKANLRRAAQDRGQDADRLIFAPHLPQDEHLARHQAADLFLDTFVVNGHATASDALWAGLPVLTLPGRQFAARVGASLLSAIDMPELIASSAADYESRARDLACDTDALAALRSKLQRNRSTTALFDTTGFAAAIEQGFDMAYDRHLQGQSPAHLTVSKGGAARPDPMDPAFLPTGQGLPRAQQIQV